MSDIGASDLVVDETALDRLFRAARTPQAWSDRPVDAATLAALYDLAKMGPTSGNCMPGRFVFVVSEDARARLRPALSAGNVERCLSAPVIAIVCQDPLFFEQLPGLNDDFSLRDWFAGDVALAEETATRNAILQGAYLLMAARALGLAGAPMSGFDGYQVEDALLAGTGWRANFLIALGYPAEAQALPPRAHRLDFDTACLCL